MRKLVVVCSLLLFACGCATYRTSGGAVSIPAITDSTIAEALARQPAAQFPAHLIVARVQATGYASATGTTCAAAFTAALKEVGKTWTAINAEHNRTTAALR